MSGKLRQAFDEPSHRESASSLRFSAEVGATELGTRNYPVDRTVDEATTVVLGVDSRTDASHLANVMLDEDHATAVPCQ